MSDTQANKQVVERLIRVVWQEGKIASLPDFWTEDCVNHAAQSPDNRGLDALRVYHEQFLTAFAAFSGVVTEIIQQVAEGDRVVTQMLSRAVHTGPFLGVPATGRSVSLAAIRIDRFRDGKIAEHWSVSDLAGLMQQIQS